MKRHTEASGGLLRACPLFRACLVACLLLLGGAHCFGAGSQPLVTWYAALYPPNPQYLEVLVDTRALPHGAYLYGVQFSVDSRDRITGRLRTSLLNFTDNSGQPGAFASLAAGSIYQRYLPLPFPQAKFIQARQLKYSVGLEGSRPGPPPHATAAANHLAFQQREERKRQKLQQITASMRPPRYLQSKQSLPAAGTLTLGPPPTR